MTLFFFLLGMGYVSFLGDWLLIAVMGILASLYMFLCVGNGGYVFSAGLYGDELSISLVLLSFWIVLKCYLASLNYGGDSNYFVKFLFFGYAMLGGLIMSFFSLDVLKFYMWFEGVFIIMYLMVSGWGYSPERYQASIYMIFYTLVVSLPFLIVLFGVSSTYLTLNFFYLYFFSEGVVSNLSWVFILMVFLVKLPIFLGHLWLPKAHVEAPLAGSMILAGVLLKLGGYGIIRLFYLGVSNTLANGAYILMWGMVGAFLVSFVCMRQSDMKALVAYSSVSHMGLVVGGLLSGKLASYLGSLLIMLAHGLCSSALFALLGVLYKRSYSRSVLVLKGSMSMMPLMGLWWFLFSMSNMASPPSLNFVSELMIMMGVMNYHYLAVIFMGGLMFLAGVYSMYMFVTMNHGGSSIWWGMSGLFVSESLLMFGHIVPLFLLLFFLDMLV